MHRDPRDSGRMHRDSQGFLSGVLRDSCLGILRDSVGILGILGILGIPKRCTGILTGILGILERRTGILSILAILSISVWQKHNCGSVTLRHLISFDILFRG